VGEGSKQDTIAYDSSKPDPLNIVKVESNLPNNFTGSAIIENLVIDGTILGNNSIGVGTTGILLEDVYNCLIRNLTIKNCEVGIRVKLTGNKGDCSHGNRFEHIRMINVKYGIVFEGNGGNRDFSFTTIDDVRISLENATARSGIKIGGSGVPANLYNAFIKATVWISHYTHKGLEVGLDGQLKFSLVNLEVEQSLPDVNPPPRGCGVFIDSGAVVDGNQNFLLTTLGLYKEENDVVVLNRRVSVQSGGFCGADEIIMVPLENSVDGELV
jgi:hypothetical protein